MPAKQLLVLLPALIAKEIAPFVIEAFFRHLVLLEGFVHLLVCIVSYDFHDFGHLLQLNVATLVELDLSNLPKDCR